MFTLKEIDEAVEKLKLPHRLCWESMDYPGCPENVSVTIVVPQNQAYITSINNKYTALNNISDLGEELMKYAMRNDIVCYRGSKTDYGDIIFRSDDSDFEVCNTPVAQFYFGVKAACADPDSSGSIIVASYFAEEGCSNLTILHDMDDVNIYVKNLSDLVPSSIEDKEEDIEWHKLGKHNIPFF